MILIAEVGNNHEGDLDVALDMLEKAQKSGADLVKFQAGTAEGFARKKSDIARYKKYELGEKGYITLFKHGKDIGIPVFFSVFGEADWLEKFRELEYFKIAARQCERQYIQKYSSDKMFVSIPNSFTKEEVQNIGIIKGIPMHCVSRYPTVNPNLSRINDLRGFLRMSIGYSDHTVGIEACIEAVKKHSAVAVEKHFTLSHSYGELRDHALSATPAEFKKLARAVKK